MYADIGGMDIQKQEVREAVELPLTHFELYKQVRSQIWQGRERPGPLGLQLVMHSLAHPPLHLWASDRHRPTPRCPHVRPTWLREDHAGKGCGSSHDR